MELTLIRSYHSLGTNGELYLDGKLLCYTIELPWIDNIKEVSCIPEGRYQLVKMYTKKFGLHYMVSNVPGRDDIFIHPANYALRELEGCIAPVSKILAHGLGEDSRKAFRKLMDMTQTEPDSKPIFITIKSKQYEHV
jgi:hypothetical protein